MLPPLRRISITLSRLKIRFGRPTGRFFPESALDGLADLPDVVVLLVA
jgi:hypothetical protein